VRSLGISRSREPFVMAPHSSDLEVPKPNPAPGARAGLIRSTPRGWPETFMRRPGMKHKWLVAHHQERC